MSGKSNKAIAIWNAISRLLWHWKTEDEEVRILHKVSRNLRPTDIHVRNHNEKYVIGVESAEKAKQLLAAIDGLLRTPELLLQRDSKGNEDVPYRPRTKVIEPDDVRAVLSVVSAHTTQTFSYKEFSAIQTALKKALDRYQAENKRKWDEMLGQEPPAASELRKDWKQALEQGLNQLRDEYEKVTTDINAIIALLDQLQEEMVRHPELQRRVKIRYTQRSGKGYRVQYYANGHRRQTGMGDILVVVGCHSLTPANERKKRLDRLKDNDALATLYGKTWWLVVDNKCATREQYETIRDGRRLTDAAGT